MALWQANIASKEVGFSVPITVITPDNINENTKTLFLLHGYTGSNLDWVRYTNIEKLALEKQICVVMPAINNSFYTNMAYGPNYYSFMSEELPTIISNTFNLKLTKENTFVIGLSMGGYGALKLAFRNPDNYFAVASFSGVVDVSKVFEYFPNNKKIMEGIFKSKENLLDKNNQDNLYNLLDNNLSNLKIYLSCGQSDTFYEDNKRFIKKLDEKNITYYFNDVSGDHNWEFWDKEIKNALNYLLS